MARAVAPLGLSEVQHPGPWGLRLWLFTPAPPGLIIELPLNQRRKDHDIVIMSCGLAPWGQRINKNLLMSPPPSNGREAAIFSGRSPRKNVDSYTGTCARFARMFSTGVTVRLRPTKRRPP